MKTQVLSESLRAFEFPGIWSLREEARKSWSYAVSNETVYFCDVEYGQFQGNGLGRMEWIAKYQSGRIWLEYHGILEGQRPAKFYALVEVNPRPTLRTNSDMSSNRSSGRNSVLIDVAEFVQLPEGMIAIGCPSLVRLKVFDDGDSLTGNVPDLFPEKLLTFRGLIRMNGEHRVLGGIVASQQGQLPSKLVKSGPQGVDQIRKTKRDVSIDNSEFTPNDMASFHEIIMFRDGIRLGPTMQGNKTVKFLEMFVRPSYFHFQII